jgi:phage baseplate assembly protein V
MTAELTDLQQRLANLIRVGRVHSVDHEAARLRVAFGKDDSNVSAWVPWMTARAGATREWNPPAVGEQVALLNPSGQDNAGFAMPGGIYRNDAPANGNTAGHYELDLPSDGAWKIRIGDVTIEAVDGSFKATVGSAVLEIAASKLTFLGDVEVAGQITATGDVIGQGISLATHVHGGVEPGGSLTSGPV